MQKQQCLEGVKILDFSWFLAGPMATKHLADFGAEVIKVESLKRPDAFRYVEPFKNGSANINSSAMFLQANTGKYSLTLNLNHPGGLEIAKRLVRWADVVTESFSPGTMHRLGLGYDQLRQENPDIIMVSSSILGNKGIYPGFGGYALMGTALSGYIHMTGYPGGEPVTPASVVVADVIQPLFAAISILSALDYRLRTGKGQWIDISQIEPMVNFIAPAILDMEVNHRSPTRMGNRHPQAVPHTAFRCQGDDAWCAIAVFAQEEWLALCRAMGDPIWARGPKFATLAARKDNEDELERLVEAWTQGVRAQDVMELLQRLGVAAGVVQTPKDLIDNDPQLRQRRCFVRLRHPVIGECFHPSSPVRLSRTPAKMRTSPLLGEHNEYVCTKILGMSKEEYDVLCRQRVFE